MEHKPLEKKVNYKDIRKKRKKEQQKERKGKTVFLKEGRIELIKSSITNHHGAVDIKVENKKGKENLHQ